MAARVEHVVTTGEFTLDGGTWDVDNNVWIVGNDEEALVIDASHDADAIAAAVGERRLTAIVCTHGHNDHINAAPALAARTGAPILLHLDDRLLWRNVHPDRSPDGYLSDRRRLTVAGTELIVLHTPGHSPGAICLYAPDLGTVFTGDTLFAAWAGCHRAVVLGLPHHHPFDPQRTPVPAAGHPGAYGARSGHDHRGRGSASGGVDRPRSLNSPLRSSQERSAQVPSK